MRGGKRRGAGRPVGSGKYGEPTIPMRVPPHLVEQVKWMCANGGRKLPLIDMARRRKAPTNAVSEIETPTNGADHAV